MTPLGGGFDEVDADRNKAVVRRHFESMWNQRDRECMAEIISTDYVEHGLAAITGTVDERHDAIEGMKGTVDWLTAAFPDLRFEICDLIGEADKVLAYTRMTGTHDGEFQGVAPTNRRVHVMAMHLFRVRDGRLVEHWAVRDDLAMMQQLGVVSF